MLPTSLWPLSSPIRLPLPHLRAILHLHRPAREGAAHLFTCCGLEYHSPQAFLHPESLCCPWLPQTQKLLCIWGDGKGGPEKETRCYFQLPQSTKVRLPSLQLLPASHSYQWQCLLQQLLFQELLIQTQAFQDWLSQRKRH